MNSNDLLDIIGETKDVYIQDTLWMQQNIIPMNRNRRRVRLTILVAIMIMVTLLATTAFATGFRIADWFGNFFGILSPEDKDIIDDIGMYPIENEPNTTESSFETVPTGNMLTAPSGAKATLLVAAGDKNNCYVRIRFEAPEGMVLGVPDKDAGVVELMNGRKLSRDENGNRLYVINCDKYEVPFDYIYEVELFDDTPGDNVMDAIVTFNVQYGDLAFNDGVPKNLYVEGLFIRGENRNYTTIIEGPWEFDLTNCASESIDLYVEGLTTPGGYGTTITLKQMTLTQIGIEAVYTYTGLNDSNAYEFGCQPEIIMKDGSVVNCSYPYGDIDRNGQRAEVQGYLDVPVDLSQVDYIQYGELQIPVAEAVEWPQHDDAVTIGQAYVAPNGSTMTLQAAFGDENTCYLKLHFEAPAGMVLNIPDEKDGFIQIMSDNELLYGPDLLSSNTYKMYNITTELTWEDITPNDNAIDLYLVIYTSPDYTPYFNDNVPKTLTINNLYLQLPGNEYSVYLEGPWAIDLGNCGGEAIAVGVDGTNVMARRGETLILKELRISSLGYWLQYEYSEWYIRDEYVQDKDIPPVPEEISVILKDGTTVPMGLLGRPTGEYTWNYGESSENTSVTKKELSDGYGVHSSSGAFAQVVDLDEIAYFQIGDLKIPVNAES